MPGALHLRSDNERKALAGVEDHECLPSEAYTRTRSAEVYHALMQRAETALRGGHAVIMDAVFATVEERVRAARLAGRLGVDFTGLWLEAAPSTLKDRVSKRIADVSDATPDVVDQQLGYDLGPIEWAKVDASGTPAETEAQVRRILPSRSAAPT